MKPFASRLEMKRGLRDFDEAVRLGFYGRKSGGVLALRCRARARRRMELDETRRV